MKLRSIQPEKDFPRVLELINMVMVEPLTMTRFQEWAQLEAPERIFRQMVGEEAWGYVIGYSEVVHEPWLPSGHFAVWLVVDPGHRGHGIGSALYAEALRFLERQGATHLTSEVRDDHPQALMFAQQCGFEIDRHLYESSLDLMAFDEAPFLPALAGLEADGIRFFSMADLNDSSEARHKLYELNRITALDIPGRKQAFRNFNEFEQTVFQAAWYRPEGQLVAADGETWVGLSAVQLRPETQGAYNLMTGVLSGWRGRKIGVALKVLAIRYAQEHGARFIFTHNDSLNAPILALNQKLGYQPKPGRYTLKKG